MSALKFRLTVYADSSKASALTPHTNAPHSDAFQVTTEQGVSGWKPYLKIPSGRRGGLDPKTRHWSSGEVRAAILDQRVGGSNTDRWVSAFTGDQDGRLILKNKPVEIEVDFGDGWEPYFGGRIAAVEAPDFRSSGAEIILTIRDARVEEYRTVFNRAPHNSVTYARGARLWPLGLPSMRGDGRSWNGFPAQATGRGTLSTDQRGADVVSLPEAQQDIEVTNFSLDRVCAALLGASDLRDTLPNGISICPNLRLRINDGTEKWYHVRSDISFVGVQEFKSYDDEEESPIYIEETDLRVVGIAELDPAHPKYASIASLPTPGTYFDIEIEHIGRPTADAPILIDQVDPVVLYEDLLEARFTAGERRDGTIPYEEVPHNQSEFDALKGTFPNVRFLVEDPSDLQEWIEKNLSQVVHLAGRASASGEVEPVDVRLPPFSTLSSIPTIDADDYIDGRWTGGTDTISLLSLDVVLYGHQREGLAKLQTEQEESALEIATHLMIREESSEVFASEEFADLPISPFRVDVRAFNSLGKQFLARGSTDLWDFSLGTSDPPRPPIYSIVEEFLGRFGAGAQFAKLTCPPNATVRALKEGEWVKVNVDHFPNAGSNVRGGVRLMQVISSDLEPANATISLSLIDAGPDAQTTAPGISNLTLDDARTASVDLDSWPTEAVTVFQVNPTLTSVGTRPAEGDLGWTTWAIREGKNIDGDTPPIDVKLVELPIDRRIWVRARSIRAGKIPSAWSHPPGDFVDTTVVPRLRFVDVDIDGNDNPVVSWNPNVHCGGVRIFYEVHDESTDPGDPLANSEDVDASASPHTITAVTVSASEAVTIDAEPWTGFSGGSVQGSAGDRQRVRDFSQATATGANPAPPIILIEEVDLDGGEGTPPGDQQFNTKFEIGAKAPGRAEVEVFIAEGANDFPSTPDVTCTQPDFTERATKIITRTSTDFSDRVLRVKAVASDGQEDRAVTVVDWDQIPEIVAISAPEPLFDTDGVPVGWILDGSVDDDTNGLLLEMPTDGSIVLNDSTPAAAGSASEGATFRWFDFSTTRSFRMEFLQSPGLTGTVKLTPYEFSDQTARGRAGKTYSQALLRNPKAYLSFQEVNPTRFLVTLTAKPIGATVNWRIDSGSWNSFVTSFSDPKIKFFIETEGVTLLEFYAEIGGIREETQQVYFDVNELPEILNRSVTEDPANNILYTVAPDDDVIRWTLWARNGSLPYRNNTTDPDDLYERIDAHVATRSVRFYAEAGTWEIVVRAYDRSGRYTEYQDTITVNGTTQNPALSELFVELEEGATDYHNVWWTHNVLVDSGDETVEIRRKDGTVLVTGRDPTLEPDDADNLTQRGGWRETVNPDPNGPARTFVYDVELKDSGGSEIATYRVSISGNYQAVGNAPTEIPNLIQARTSGDPVFGETTYTWENTNETWEIELEIDHETVNSEDKTVTLPAGRTWYVTEQAAWGDRNRVRLRYKNQYGNGPWTNGGSFTAWHDSSVAGTTTL